MFANFKLCRFDRCLSPFTPQVYVCIAKMVFQVLKHYYALYPWSPVTEDEVQTKFENLCGGIKFLENELKSRGESYFGGSDLKFIDYMIWPWFERMSALEMLRDAQIPWENFPLLVRKSISNISHFC